MTTDPCPGFEACHYWPACAEWCNGCVNCNGIHRESVGIHLEEDTTPWPPPLQPDENWETWQTSVGETFTHASLWTHPTDGQLLGTWDEAIGWVGAPIPRRWIGRPIRALAALLRFLARHTYRAAHRRPAPPTVTPGGDRVVIRLHTQDPRPGSEPCECIWIDHPHTKAAHK